MQGRVEEIQIPLQPIGKQVNGIKLTNKQKKAIKNQHIVSGRNCGQEERFGYRETLSKSFMKLPL